MTATNIELQQDKLSFDTVRTLAEQFGDSFYILDTDRFQQNQTDFLSAFESRYPSVRLAYSYKTNYIPILCGLSREFGSFAEVVSPFEYEMARVLGNSPSNIIFNGPVKPFDSIRAALEDGAIVNLDSVEEFGFVEQLAKSRADETFRIGLRCNVGVEPEEGSRFGMDRGSIDGIFAALEKVDNIKVTCLHTHFSYRRDAESYALRAEKLADIFNSYREKQPIQFFDLGGGFFGPVSEKIAKQFSQPPATYDQYADAICTVLNSKLQDPLPQLVLEPGVGIVANVLSFICQIQAIKRTPTRLIANSSGSVQNIKPAKSRFNLPMTVLSPQPDHLAESAQSTDICGFTCMEDDVMFHGFRQQVHTGDFVRFDNVGAYTLTFKPQFIRSAPPIIYSAGGKWRLARRRETVDDVLSTYARD